ncbi:MAG: ribonuclease D [Alphaproteobacteria bacterium]|nr:ribonuclease D [Alphaproteobacteria bacterium]
MHIITSTAALTAVISRFAGSAFVALDTEFMRDQTYWPKLCLIQAATPDEAVIIDPLAPGIDLEPFFGLLKDASILKVFHAARQDVEIFFHMTGAIPAPLFDTQVAAMVCGFGESVSYETLARKLANAQIDKSSRFTDWAKRPLSDKQLDYALGDVTHLCRVYQGLSAELAKTGREQWVREEIEILTSTSTYTLHPEDAWRRLKTRSTSRRFLGVLMAVAAWREREAQERDVPRGRILKDEALVEVAAQAPKSVAELDALRAVPRGFAQSRLGAPLLAAIREGLAAPLDSIPSPERYEPLPDGLQPLIDFLKLLLKARAEMFGVAPRLVANADDIERLAAEDDPDIPALQGWRREVFGEAALELKRGRIAFTVRDGKVVAVPVEG